MKWMRAAGVMVALATATATAACGAEAPNEAGQVAGSGDLVELGAGPAPAAVVSVGDGAVSPPTSAVTAVGPVTTTTSIGNRPLTTTTVAPLVDDARSIEPMMVTAGPAGYERERDRDVETGAIDFDAAVYEDGEEDSAKFFRRYQFEAGWDRSWARGDIEDVDGENPYFDVYDTVYRFREASGAEAYMRRVVDYIEDTNEMMEYDTTTFTVAGVPGAKGYAASEDEYHFAAVVFTKGRFTVRIESSEESKDKAREVASAMARDQYARL